MTVLLSLPPTGGQVLFLSATRGSVHLWLHPPVPQNVRFTSTKH